MAAEIVLEKHLKTNTRTAVRPVRRRSRRKTAACILVVELIALAAVSYVFCSMAWENHVLFQSSQILSCLDCGKLEGNAEHAYAIALEQVKEERDETVWATENVVYRKRPGEKYKEEGSLYEAASMTRTGVTYNDWSRVRINGEEYYIFSEYLTTEEPLITATGAKGDYQRYALSQFGKYGWADEEIRPLISLWNRESGWNPRSHNKKSGAHGIPQALPAGKMASEGSDYYTNGNTQIRWGLNYIYNRYGSPSAAWRHFQSSGWY